jgi:hypothetical protein
MTRTQSCSLNHPDGGPPFLVDDGATTVVARANGMKAFPIGGGAGTLIDARARRSPRRTP